MIKLQKLLFQASAVVVMEGALLSIPKHAEARMICGGQCSQFCFEDSCLELNDGVCPVFQGCAEPPSGQCLPGNVMVVCGAS